MPGNRAAIARALAVLVATWSAACVTEQLTEPTTMQIVVQAVLDPSSRVQEVLVQEASTGQRPGHCVLDAQVTIVAPDGVPMRGVQPAPCGPYVVALDEYGVRLLPGGTYALRVATPDGHVITGTTTIPDRQPADVPPSVEPFSAGKDTLRLDFASVAGAAAYELRISSQHTAYRRFVVSPATVRGLARDINGGPVFTLGAMNATVAAVDSNYYDYYRTISDPIGGGVLLSRLEGGVGVFGSIVVIERRRLDVVP